MQSLRPIWRRFFDYNWKFALFLILLFGIPRFFVVLGANISGNYQFVSIIFMVMWLTPLIFLTKKGREDAGIRRPANMRWLLYALMIGILFCAFSYITMTLLYGHSINNSFVYISKSYTVPNHDLKTFAIFASIAMTFSPIGEELFYRGVVHGGFVGSSGEIVASRFDSLAFALTHLAHFGIIYVAGKWEFPLIPATLWVLSMFIVCRLFFVCKQKSGSILGAILCHAGYNLAMMYFIFYHILK